MIEISGTTGQTTEMATQRGHKGKLREKGEVEIARKFEQGRREGRGKG